jgi:hypothetical protein
VNVGKFEEMGYEHKEFWGCSYLTKGNVRVTINERGRGVNVEIGNVSFMFLEVNRKGRWKHRMRGDATLPKSPPPGGKYEQELKRPLSVPYHKTHDHEYLVDRIRKLKELC